MSLKDTMQRLNVLLVAIIKDLGKVQKGNRAAAQRVRVGTIRLEKLAKIFRKESVTAEKGGRLRKKAASQSKRKKRAGTLSARVPPRV